MNQLVPISQSNAEAYRMSTDAAGLCGEIVKATAMEIQRRRYVRVEGWMALAVAHGCMASAKDVERIEGGVRAVGEVRRMSDGALMAQGEGFVGEDEPTWYGGEVSNQYGKKVLPKRPDYAIRAMAQTRAISRACRSAFAHVVVMIDANLSTTPAEEVPYGGFDNDAIEDDFAATPQPRKSSAQAKKDGDYERLQSGLDACEDIDALKAWGAAEADAIGALPSKWQMIFRECYADKMRSFKAKIADPNNVFIDPPADDAPTAEWEAYLDTVLQAVMGSPSIAEVEDVQATNGSGIERLALLIEDAPERIAAIAEQRIAELMAKAA